jgi:hypothetical protein
VLSAARGIEAKACGDDCVDVFDTSHPYEVIHQPADHFAAFLAKAKAGHFDHLVPTEVKPPAGDPPVPGRAP